MDGHFCYRFESWEYSHFSEPKNMSRPLLPAPSHHHRNSSSQSPGSDSSLTLASGIPLKKRNKPIASACTHCRTRKSRCDGARPKCTPCERRNLTCQYQASTLELQQQSGAYQELFCILASKPHSEATEILDRIRKGNDVASILGRIREADLLLQLHVKPSTHYQYQFPYSRDMPKFLMRDGNHYFDSWIYKFSSDGPQPNEISIKDPIIYQVPYHAAEVADPHLDAIKTKKWTSVIDDDKLLRKLVQTYFLKEYPFFPAFQKDYFLQDMLSGRKQYCSPLLVHAVLASACHGYSEAQNRAEFWNTQTLGYQFLAESRRLWELEAAKPRLTTIQAAIVLAVVYDANGADEIGRQYLMQAIAAAHNMHLFSHLTGIDDEVEHNARAITAWSLFGLQAVHSFHVFKAPLLSMPPSIALPEISEETNNYGDLCLRYPSSRQPISVKYGRTFIAIAQFRVIINDIAAMFFTKVERPVNVTVNGIQGFCVRLDSWYQNLPEDLAAREICFPWQLKLHMHYYNLIICLLETLTLTCKQALYDVSVQRALNEAKIRLETILRLYYLRHGYESYDIFLLSLLSSLGFMQLRTMNSTGPGELESARSTVALVFKGLHDQSRNFYLAEIVFRIMKRSMDADSYCLLKDVDIGDEDQEAAIRMSEQVHSSWPIDIHSIDENADNQRIQNLIKKTDRLRV